MNEAPSTIRLYGMVNDSIVDGPGFRFSIFTQGCPHHCAGCHNPESHDPDGGTEYSLEEVEKRFSRNPLLSGITLSGGEPFEQPEACAELARRAHRLGLNVWTFTGDVLESHMEKARSNPAVQALLDETDVLVDGPFMLSQRSLDLLYCGSKNQRIIDMNKTRQEGKIVIWSAPEW